MDDLFAGSMQVDTLGLDAIWGKLPIFFAIYPMAADLPRVVEWQQRVCSQFEPPEIALRKPWGLHISVAECKKPKRQTQSLEEIIRSAVRHFSYPSFELTLVSTARFGDGSALVAVADEAGSQALHGLRLAIADAQERERLPASRGKSEAHLTLGYRDGLPAERRAIEPISFRVETVDLAVSIFGHTEHKHVASWRLTP